ncbi:Pollen-specific leucine-rich repeat extensin-like protein 3 [Vitis vinifera]|uniref:Pollen-specific leucine-rich repeat extensin-like protein 3 n=1 Tax=Vitis vinifera TaxID=29760 RepID=A0A438EGQ4_VITVI|nr:Pollen-specific leucine-rich repeat extensin-like protein 3 [Vitis vinifera]
MASSSSSMATHFLILLLLQFSFLFNNLAAKHGSPATRHHRAHNRPHNHSSTSNPRLQQAYIALQAWKRVIYSDPNKFTSNWVGPSVCSYKAGSLPDELGLLTDLALLHLNSNRFCGIIPETFANLTLLFELDISNNRFVGPFPSVVVSLPTLKFLDIRFNEFEGALPPDVFNRGLDAIFVNNNLFNTLEELLLFNTSLSGCLPQEIGFLYKLRVLDVSFNKVVGTIPYSLAGLAHLEQLEEGICQNLTSNGIKYDDRRNCLPDKPLQRSKKQCEAVYKHPVDCLEHHCSGGGGGTGAAVAPMHAASSLASPPTHS